MSSTNIEDLTVNNNKNPSLKEDKHGWVRSENYWYEDDGSIVIRIECVLYKVHKGYLLKVSEVMQAILFIPDGKEKDDPTCEGTNKFPLFLDGIKAQEFDDFLGGFLYRMDWHSMSDDVKERVYSNLLKLSCLWEIEAGKKYAQKHLEDIYLSSPRRLELACRFRIQEWVAPAVKSILKRPLSELNAGDLERIGLHVFVILVKGKEYMDVEIKRTARLAPPMIEDPSWECENHKSCIKVWKRLWCDQIGQKLLHPTFSITPDQIAWNVHKFQHGGLNPKCLRDMEEIITNDSYFFEERVVSATARAILQLYNMLAA
ncbi:hypothetical protein K438DRAFT_1974420 [Mycena galopus ATCC 62051]|nr:hypothetical protein K438DRAFT_1974420 [Mycena galopus ATCC 62051]